MNATKRKFNALLQGIGTRPVPAADGTTDSPHSLLDSTPISTASAPPFSPATMTTTTATATASKTTVPSSAAAKMEFLAKRRRTALGAAVAARPAAAGTTSSSDLLRRWGSSSSSSTTGRTTQTSQTPQTQPPAPRFCPDDRTQLLRRLATFQELTDWMPKPDRINEIEWAKRGWVCQGKERVRCTLCSKEVVVQLSGTADSNDTKTASAVASVPAEEEGASGEDAGATGEALVDRYADLLVAAHQEDCLWRKKGCDDSLLRLPLASPRQAVANLRQRYDELCARQAFLPYEFNLRLPQALDLDAVLSTLPPGFFDDAAVGPPGTAASPAPPASPTINRAALALAVMGWQGLTNSRIGAVPNSASCHACLRRLGLWMFKSKHVDPETGTVLEPAPMDHLDAVREHRFFCPWRNGTVQRNPGARTGRSHAQSKAPADDTPPPPGWLVLVQVLRNDAYLRNRVGRPPAAAAAAKTPGSRPATAGGTPAQASPTGAKEDTAAETPTTPVRQTVTAVTDGDVLVPTGDAEDDEEDEASREAKDKERWARLRRVKSLFDTKGTMAKKLRRAGVGGGGSSSRPGTSDSPATRPQSRSEA